MNFQQTCEYYKSIGFVLIPMKVWWSEEKKKYQKIALCKWGQVDPDMSQYYNKIGIDIAVVTGPRSGVFSIDVDNIRKETILDETTKKFLTEIETAGTRKYNTRGGNYQYLFRCSGGSLITNREDIFNTKKHFGYAIDIRGAGGLTVIPPSQGYIWANGNKITACSERILQQISDTSTGVSTGVISDAMPAKSEGRMEWILRKSGAMIANHRTYDEVLSYMRYKNNTAVDPWDEKELDDKIEYIYNKHKHKDPPNENKIPVTLNCEANNTFSELIQDLKGTPQVSPELTTGFKKLDETTWGYSRGHLTLLTGVSESGKSMLAQISFLRNIERGKKCLMFSAELMAKDVHKRLLIHKLGIPSARFNDRKFTPEHREMINGQLNLWQQCSNNMLIHTQNLSPEQINAVTRLQRPDIIFIDYFQNLIFEGDGHMYMTRVTQIFHSLAKELNIAVVVLSQLHDHYDSVWNKEKGRSERKKVDSHRGDVKMTKSLVQAADVLLTLNYRHDDNSDLKALRIGVDKNKVTGRVKTMFYQFNSDTLNYKPTNANVYYGIGG